MSSQDENYAGVYDNTLGFGERPALILIDFVEAYFRQSNELWANPGEALDSALRLREIAHANDIPTIVTNVVYDPKGITGGVFLKRRSRCAILCRTLLRMVGPRDLCQMTKTYC